MTSRLDGNSECHRLKLLHEVLICSMLAWPSPSTQQVLQILHNTTPATPFALRAFALRTIPPLIQYFQASPPVLLIVLFRSPGIIFIMLILIRVTSNPEVCGRGRREDHARCRGGRQKGMQVFGEVTVAAGTGLGGADVGVASDAGGEAAGRDVRGMGIGGMRGSAVGSCLGGRYIACRRMLSVTKRLKVQEGRTYPSPPGHSGRMLVL